MPSVRIAPLALALAALLCAPAGAHQEASTPKPATAARIDIGGDPRTAPSAAKPTLALVGGRWFDGAAFRRTTWYSVDGRLTARRPARVDATVDLKGRWVLPPLAEAHNHNLQNRWGAQTFAPDYLRRGIFYTAQLAATAEDIAPFRGFLNHPGAVDALWAEVTISSSDGHPIALAVGLAKQNGITLTPEELRDRAFVVVDTAADIEAKWERIAAVRPKLIKVIVIDSANYEARRQQPSDFGRNGMDVRLLPEIVRRAHAIGARVAVHVDTAADFDAVVRAGADMVAHLPGSSIAKGESLDQFRLSDAAVAEAARRKVMVVPTVAVTRYFLNRRPEETGAVMAVFRDNLSRLKAAGVPLLTGSDLYDGSVLDEMEALERTGVFTRAEILRMSGTDTARALFPDRDLGRFAEGAEASFVAYQADPSRDLAALRRPVLLVKQGEVLAR